MPVVAAVMVGSSFGAASAAFAAGTLFTSAAGLAAGATLVGGALSLVGTATGDKNLESDGLMLGTIGSLGMGLTGAGAAEAGGEMSKDAFMKAGTEGGAQSAGSLTDAAISSGTGAPIVGAAPAAVNPLAASDARFMELMKANESAKQMNMIGNVGQGLSTAYTGYQQQQQAEDMFNQRRADEQALIEERRRNMNVTGITAPVAPRVVPQGLIGQASLPANPVTGSGLTTMQIK